MNTHDPVTTAGDATAFGIIAGAWMNWLPTVATILSIIWVAIRIYETDTVQRLLGYKEKTNEHREDKGQSRE